MTETQERRPTATRSREREERILSFYALSDVWGQARYGEYLAADVAFRFGNAPAMKGVAAIQALADQMEAQLSDIRHSVVNLVSGQDGHHVTAELEMRYVRNDGHVVEVPAAVVFRFDARDLIDEYRIYVDTADLLSGS